MSLYYLNSNTVISRDCGGFLNPYNILNLNTLEFNSVTEIDVLPLPLAKDAPVDPYTPSPGVDISKVPYAPLHPNGNTILTF